MRTVHVGASLLAMLFIRPPRIAGTPDRSKLAPTVAEVAR